MYRDFFEVLDVLKHNDAYSIQAKIILALQHYNTSILKLVGVPGNHYNQSPQEVVAMTKDNAVRYRLTDDDITELRRLIERGVDIVDLLASVTVAGLKLGIRYMPDSKTYCVTVTDAGETDWSRQKFYSCFSDDLYKALLQSYYVAIAVAHGDLMKLPRQSPRSDW